MKRIAIAVMFVIFPLFLLPKVGRSSGIASNAMSQQEREEQKRRPVAHKWISALEAVALRSNNPGAQEIAHFLRFDSCVAFPEDKNGIPSSTRLDFYPCNVGMIPLLPEDTKINKGWEDIGSKLKGARVIYLPGTDPVILIRDIPMTDFWRGLSLLHEGVISAEILEKEKTVDPSEFDSWLWERAEMEDSAWGVMIETLQAAGGKDFKSLMDSKQPKSSRTSLIFGDPLSSFEENLRETALWIITAIDIINKQDSDPQKQQKGRIKFFYEALKNNRL